MRHRLKAPTSRLHIYESALALHKLLSPIKLEAQYPDQGKPYYVAHSSVNALALTEPLSGEKFLTMVRIHFTGGPGRNVFEPWEFLKFIVNFKDVSLRSNGFYQL